MRLLSEVGVACWLLLFQPAGALVVYVNSYHAGYPSSDDVMAGVVETLTAEGVRVETIFLDTKRRSSEAEIAAAAARALEEIQRRRPAVLVVSDDDAVRSLVVPHFAGGPLPVVFCGVNWSADRYGLPTRYVTGMVEVLPIAETLSTLAAYYPDLRRAIVLSERSAAEESNRIAMTPILAGRGLTAEWRLVATFDEWKAEFRRANAAADLIVLPTNGGIAGWRDEDAERFVAAEIRRPVVTNDDFMMRYAVFGRVKVAREQGEWAGRTALRILGGESPSAIPLARNQRSRALINRTLAARIGFAPSAALEKELAR